MTLTSAGIINIPIIDSFEDADISEYSGDTGNATVVDETNVTPDARDGSKLLEIAGQQTDLVSTSGLDNYVSKGQEATFWFYITAAFDAYAGFAFRVQDASNFFSAEVNTNDGNMLIRDGYDGTDLEVNFSVSVSDDTWFKGVVQLDDGSTFGGVDNDINFEIFDTDGNSVQRISANDASGATEDGIGWTTRSDSNEVYFDYAHLSQA